MAAAKGPGEVPSTAPSLRLTAWLAVCVAAAAVAAGLATLPGWVDRLDAGSAAAGSLISLLLVVVAHGVRTAAAGRASLLRELLSRDYVLGLAMIVAAVTLFNVFDAVMYRRDAGSWRDGFTVVAVGFPPFLAAITVLRLVGLAWRRIRRRSAEKTA